MIIRSHLQATDTDIFIPLPFQQFFEYGISVRFSGSPCGCLRLFFFRFQRFFSHLGFDDPLWKYFRRLFGIRVSGAILQVFRMTGENSFGFLDVGFRQTGHVGSR
ncbi:unnamed protein product [Rhizophagus irregularis]|nr:unnamed protein product [Rhizophagus irregularis]